MYRSCFVVAMQLCIIVYYSMALLLHQSQAWSIYSKGMTQSGKNSVNIRSTEHVTNVTLLPPVCVLAVKKNTV